MIPVEEIEQGCCFRKKNGTFAYIRFSDSSVKFHRLNHETHIYGACYNGNITKVAKGTLVEPVDVSVMRENDDSFFSDMIAQHQNKVGPLNKGLSKLKSWQLNIVKYERSSWNDTYLSMAHVLAKRSHDSQTQCGCIITTTDHKPLGMGYNGFPAGIPDNFLPNTRPEKYPWMIHAELNAILNCSHGPKGGIAFVTGHPCLHCLMCLCQVGIREVIYDVNHSINMINEEEETKLEIMKWLAAEKIHVIGYDYHDK